MGRKSHTKGPARSYTLGPETFPGRGEGLASHRLAVGAQAHNAPTHTRPSLPPVWSLTPCLSPPFFRLFQRRFTIMAALTQALEIGPVDEPGPVPTVGLHVIHHRGPGTDTTLGTLPAPGLGQELGGPQIVGPDGQAVPAVPLCRLPAGSPPGLMFGTVAVPGQFPTSGMAAGPERLHGYGLSPPGKTKSAQATAPLLGWNIGSGAGLFGRWLRRFDIHECLLPTALALSGQVPGDGIRPDLQDFSLLAYRTDNPSVLYD